MSEKEIQEKIQLQIDALKEATNNATKSKEAAYEYLLSSGIIDGEKDSRFDGKKK